MGLPPGYPKNSIVSDQVQKTPEGHMSSDGTTARRADVQQRSVDDVSAEPSRRQEHSRQLDTDEAATSQDDDFVLDALRHVKPVEIVMHQLAASHVAVWSPGKNDITVIHT